MGIRMYNTCPNCQTTIYVYNNGKTTTYPHNYNCDTMKQQRIIQCRMEQMFGK